MRFLLERDTDIRELMDDPGCDPVRLARTYARFAVVNRLISGWGVVFRDIVRPLLHARGGRTRILDLGCGGGDVLVRMSRTAARAGLAAEWVGVDPDPRAIHAASERTAPHVRFECTDSTSLRAQGARFDLVLSNHVLHHLGDDELRSFATDSRALSSGLVLHGDIERSTTAYALYTAGITPFAPGTFLRTDGLRSIRRSYRAGELSAALNGTGAWVVRRPAPFRLLAIGRGTGDGDA